MMIRDETLLEQRNDTIVETRETKH
jgi:hypothetical protein